MSCEHSWQITGRQAVHAKVGKAIPVYYLFCCRCKQSGFQRGGSAVVYTWTQDETQWEVA